MLRLTLPRAPDQDGPPGPPPRLRRARGARASADSGTGPGPGPPLARRPRRRRREQSPGPTRVTPVAAGSLPGQAESDTVRLSRSQHCQAVVVLNS